MEELQKLDHGKLEVGDTIRLARGGLDHTFEIKEIKKEERWYPAVSDGEEWFETHEPWDIVELVSFAHNIPNAQFFAFFDWDRNLHMVQRSGHPLNRGWILDGKKMSQEDLAKFTHGHKPTVLVPRGADNGTEEWAVEVRPSEDDLERVVDDGRGQYGRTDRPFTEPEARAFSREFSNRLPVVSRTVTYGEWTIR